MPILGYFAVVAPVLLGLLCLAETVMGPPGAMPLTTSATGLPVAYVAPRTTPVLTVREGLVAEIPKGQDTGKDGTGKDGYALASAASVAVAAPAQPSVKPVKVAKARKKSPPQQQVAQFGWQQNEPQNQAQNQAWGGWDQQRQKKSGGKVNRNSSAGRYAMSGQQPFFSPFGMIR